LREKVSRKELQNELRKAHRLIAGYFGVKFKMPKILAGDRYSSEFMKIENARDLIAFNSTKMAYDDETNSIFVPDHMLGPQDWRDQDNGRTYRIFCFLHEDMHALLVSKNLQFRETALKKLELEEQRIVYNIFNEGLATYIAVYIALHSRSHLLIEEGKDVQETLREFWEQWRKSCLPVIIPIVQSRRPDLRDWRQIYLYYKDCYCSFPVDLEMYKYQIGYNFFDIIKPSKQLILKMIDCPPQKIEHLLYPEKYLETINKELMKSSCYKCKR